MAGGNTSSSASGHLRSRIRGWIPWIVLACLGFGPLFACALIGPPDLVGDLGLKAAPDWSRGLHVGSEFYGLDSGAPLVVDDRGRVHLLWTLRHSANDYDLRYLRLDERGVVEEEHDLGIELYEPRRVRLLLDGEQFLQVFLVGLEERGEPPSLFHLRLTSDGWPDRDLTLVSSGSSPCHEYDVTFNSAGVMHLFWTEGVGRERDMFHLALSSGLPTAEAPRLIASGVSAPVARTDGRDGIHLLWERPGADDESVELHYAPFSDSSVGTMTGIKLLDLPAGPRFDRDGPVLALDSRYGYVVWTQEYRASRLASGAKEGWYGSFVLDSPSAVDARPFSLPMDEKPTYVEYDSPHGYGNLVPLAGDAELASERIADPSALMSTEEAIVTCSAIVMHGTSRESQIVNVVFAGGQPSGYQLACNTSHWSRLPNIAADTSGQLHLSWVDGLQPGPSEVYYASTSAVVRDRIDGLTVDDLLFAALNITFSAMTGVPMIPFVVLWVIPPLIWTFIASRLLGEESARRASGYLALAIAVVIYQASKLYFTPTLLGYVPFSVSVPFLPADLYLPLQVLVPVGIAGLAALGVAYTLLARGSRSLFTACLVFVLIDAFLTMAIYGPALVVL